MGKRTGTQSMSLIVNRNYVLTGADIWKRLLKNIVRRVFVIYRFVTLFCLGIVLLYPIMNMLSVALRPDYQLTDPLVVWIPRSFTLENIKRAWDGLNFPKASLYSFIITIGSSLLQLVSCSMAGYGFARYKFKGRNWLFTVVLFTILVPPQTIIIPKYIQLWKFDFFGIGSIARIFTGRTLSVNLLGTVLAMLIPAALGVGIRGGLFIYIFRQFFRGMARELEDAAYIDGCGPFQAFVRVIVPGALVVYITVFIFSVVWYWNDYLNSIMYMGGIPTVSTKLMALRGAIATKLFRGGMQTENPYQLSVAVQAGCLLVSAPLLIMYGFLQRYFTESIERTGIVG